MTTCSSIQERERDTWTSCGHEVSVGTDAKQHSARERESRSLFPPLTAGTTFSGVLSSSSLTSSPTAESESVSLATWGGEREREGEREGERKGGTKEGREEGRGK